MILQNTRESALRRDEFHRVLQEWLDESYDGTIGDAHSHSGPAWLWVRHGGGHFYLDAGSTRSGVRAYLKVVGSAAGEIEWQAESASTGIRERVGIGLEKTHIDGFELYRHLPSR